MALEVESFLVVLGINIVLIFSFGLKCACMLMGGGRIGVSTGILTVNSP